MPNRTLALAIGGATLRAVLRREHAARTTRAGLLRRAAHARRRPPPPTCARSPPAHDLHWDAVVSALPPSWSPTASSRSLFTTASASIARWPFELESHLPFDLDRRGRRLPAARHRRARRPSCSRLWHRKRRARPLGGARRRGRRRPACRPTWRRSAGLNVAPPRAGPDRRIAQTAFLTLRRRPHHGRAPARQPPRRIARAQRRCGHER